MTDPDQTDLLRELIENVDAFRQTTVETFRVLHRKQKNLDKRYDQLWLILKLVIAVVGVIVFIFVVATLAAVAK